MTYSFEFRLGDERVAVGELSSVCCVIEPGERPRAIPIPVEIVTAIRELKRDREGDQIESSAEPT